MMGKTLIGVISSSDIAVTLQCAMTLFADIFSSESTVIEEAFEEVA